MYDPELEEILCFVNDIFNEEESEVPMEIARQSKEAFSEMSLNECVRTFKPVSAVV